MKLHSLKIIGFKRIASAVILFGDATFLIGPNNAGGVLLYDGEALTTFGNNLYAVPVSACGIK